MYKPLYCLFKEKYSSERYTDIRYIQKVLGHKSIKTTERYTHITDVQKAAIISPLDHIDMEY